MKINKNWTHAGHMLTLSCGLATSALTLTAAASFLPMPVVAQVQKGVTVKGVVKDKTGEPVIGANVVEKGTTNGATTDLDGNYSVTLQNANSSLVISFVGYKTQEVRPNGKGALTIVLEEDSELLEDVVVIGYGTQKKGDVTSSVASVKAEDFNAGKIGDD